MSSAGQTATVVLSNIFLFTLIMGMAGTTDLARFRTKLKNYRGIGTGVTCQFLLLPFLGFCSVSAFQLEPLFGIMLLILTTSPGGGLSGWWCMVGNADLTLSVAMTTVSTLISIGFLPLNLLIYVQAIYGVAVGLNWPGIMTAVAVVIAGVIVGLSIGTKWPQHKGLMNKLGSFGGIANIVVALVVASGGSSEGDEEGPSGPEATLMSLQSLQPTWWLAVAAPCILGLLIAFTIAKCLRCSDPEAVAICIECCYQNTSLAFTIAVSIFPTPAQSARALLVPIYYGVVEIVLIGIFVLIAWRLSWTYAPKDVGLFKCIVGNYQPSSDEDEQKALEAQRARSLGLTPLNGGASDENGEVPPQSSTEHPQSGRV